MTDHLAKLSPPDLATFYRRIADYIDTHNSKACSNHNPCVAKPLAPVLLRKWLDNRQKNTVFSVDAPEHLKTSQEVKDALLYHRKVFLTEEKARIGPRFSARHVWAGVLPRLLKKPGFRQWLPGNRLNMHYESNVQFGTSKADIVRIQLSGTPAEQDLFTSLRGWALKSTVAVTGQSLPNKVKVAFVSWMCTGEDLYDFAKVKGLTVPNPDFNKDFKGAIQPKEKKIKVHHSNAIRLEKAGLAMPYKVQVKAWHPSDVAVTKPGDVDLTRKL